MGTLKINKVWLVEYESGEYSDNVYGVHSVHGTELGAQLVVAELEGLRKTRQNWKCSNCGKSGRSNYHYETKTHCMKHDYPQKDVWLHDDYFVTKHEVLWP